MKNSYSKPGLNIIFITCKTYLMAVVIFITKVIFIFFRKKHKKKKRQTDNEAFSNIGLNKHVFLKLCKEHAGKTSVII